MSTTFQAGRIAYVQQEALSTVKGLIDQGKHAEAVEFISHPINSKHVGDLAGALNYWAAQQPQMPVEVWDKVSTPGGGNVIFEATDSAIIAFPISLSVPTKGYASAAEYGVGPAERIAKISKIVGDITGGSVGNQVTLDFDLPAGLFYYNTVLQPGRPQTRSVFSVHNG